MTSLSVWCARFLACVAERCLDLDSQGKGSGRAMPGADLEEQKEHKGE